MRPVPVAVPPSGIWPTRGSVPRTRSAPEADLRGVAAELLAERDGDGVHQVGAAGLDDVGELLGLALERRREPSMAGSRSWLTSLERREVDRGREDVVRRLAHVHVVVRVGVVAGEVGDHLVRVHVRRGPGAGLEDVDGNWSSCSPVRPRRRRRRCARRCRRSRRPELGVDAGGRRLDPPEPVDDRRRDRLPGDREVRDRLARLSPQSCSRCSVSVAAIVPPSRSIRSASPAAYPFPKARSNAAPSVPPCGLEASGGVDPAHEVRLARRVRRALVKRRRPGSRG